MFAFFLAAAASTAVAADVPGRTANIINSYELDQAKLSVRDLPLDFPEGTATMEIGVSAKGRLTTCRMTAWEVGGPAAPDIEKSICDTLRRKAKLDAALDAAGRPIDSLLSVGIDPVLPDEPDLPTLAGLFSSEDYPMAALRSGAAGTVTVRVDVGADGKPTQCSLMKSSKNGALDEKTCEIFLKRAKFVTGKDAAGRAIAGHAIQRVRWQLPDYQALKDSVLRTSMTFDADGKPSGCQSYFDEGRAKQEACALLQGVAAKALTPVQRAFRSLVKEEGVLLGPRQAADQVGRHKGEDRLAMLAAFITVNDRGQVTSCEAVDSQQQGEAAALCNSTRRTKFARDDAAPAGDLTAVTYSALVLRRPGY